MGSWWCKMKQRSTCASENALNNYSCSYFQFYCRRKSGHCHPLGNRHGWPCIYLLFYFFSFLKRWPLKSQNLIRCLPQSWSSKHKIWLPWDVVLSLCESFQQCLTGEKTAKPYPLRTWSPVAFPQIQASCWSDMRKELTAEITRAALLTAKETW